MEEISTGTEFLRTTTDYLVMELLEGETLADRLRKGPLPLKQALEYGIEIAGALEKAHKNDSLGPMVLFRSPAGPALPAPDAALHGV